MQASIELPLLEFAIHSDLEPLFDLGEDLILNNILSPSVNQQSNAITANNSVLHDFVEKLLSNQLNAAIQIVKDKPDFLKQTNLELSFNNLIRLFWYLLHRRIPFLINSIWINNPKLSFYFSGNSVTVESITVLGQIEQQTMRLTVPELIDYFKVTLSIQCSEVIKSMWLNPKLADYFCGKPITLEINNTNGQIEQQTMQLTVPELIAYFKVALTSRCSEVIKSMWGNPRLAAYFCGKPITLELTNTEGQIEQQTMKLTVPELIAYFIAALTSRCSEIVKSMWGNPRLAAYFCGKPIITKITNTEGQIELQTLKATIPELITYFKAALASQRSAAIKLIWSNNPKLASYFCGKPITIDLTNTEGQIEQQTMELTVPELIAYFKVALASHCPEVIKSMWDNHRLASYFCGKPITLVITNTEGQIEQQILQATKQELIVYFKAALASHCSEIFESMWNKPLHDAIKELNDEKLINLIEKVLSSSPSGKNRFMSTFLSSISSKSVLTICLSKREAKSQTVYVQKQVKVLRDRIASLETSPQQQSNQKNSKALNNYGVFGTQSGTKHANDDTAINLSNKKQKTDQIELACTI